MSKKYFKNLFTPKHNFLIMCFALYMFFYMTSLTAINYNATGVVGYDEQILFYYIDMALVVVGFIVYAFYYDVLNKKEFPFVISIIYIVLLMTVFFIKGKVIYEIFAPMAFLLLGFFGGFFYTFMANGSYGDKYQGMIMGLGGALAIFVQCFIQIFLKVPANIIFLLDILIVIVFIVFKGRYKEYVPVLSDTKENIKYNDVLIVLIVAGIVFLEFCFDNKLEYLLVMDEFTNYNIYSWPRIIAGFSYILFGFVHDARKGRYDEIMLLVAALICIISTIILTLINNFNLAIILFYLQLGLLLSYYNLVFWNLAVHKKYLSLWASMGRIIDGGVSVILAICISGVIDLYVEIIIEIIVVILTLVLITISSNKRIDNAQYEFDVDEFARQYELTQRESEVLLLLLNPDIGVEEMAEQFYISRRTLQRHISSIYEKCKVNNRPGLIKLVYKH